MHPVVATGLQAFQVCQRREQREDGVLFGDAEVMDGREVGLLEPLFRDQVAVLVGDAVGHVVRAQAAGLVAEEEQLTGHRVDAHVCGHRFRAQLAAKVIATDRLERVRVHFVAACIFLGHDQPAGMPDRRGVGDRAVHVLHFGQVGEAVAVFAEQRVARLALGLEARRPHIADVVVDGAAVDVEAADHAVARQGDVVRVARGVGRIGHGAEEGALDLGRDLPFDLQVAGRPFDADGTIETVELDGIRISSHGVSPCCDRNAKRTDSAQQDNRGNHDEPTGLRPVSRLF